MNDIPTCSDFVIAAIRTLRRRSAHTSTGTLAGVQTLKVIGAASEIYSDADIQSAFANLLNSGSVVAISRVRMSENAYSVSRKIVSIDVNALRSGTVVFRDGAVVCADGQGGGIVIKILLYLREDGLPNYAAKADSPRLSDRILAAMKKGN